MRIKLALLVLAALAVLPGGAVSPMLPALADAFADTPGVELRVGLVMSLPAIFVVLSAPFAGALVERFGRLPMLYLGLAIFVAAGASGAVADSLDAILLGRAVLGVAAGLLLTLSTTLISDLFEGPERAALLGYQGAFMNATGIFVVLLAGILTDLSWRAPFLIFLSPLALYALAAPVLREPPEPQRGRRAIASLPVRRLLPIYLYMMMAQLAFFSLLIRIPFLVQDEFGGSGADTGFAISATTVVATVSALLHARLQRLTGYAAVTTCMLLALGGGLVFAGTAAGPPGLVAGLVMAGAGLGLLMPNLGGWLTALVSRRERAAAVSGLTSALYLGQFVAPFVLALLQADDTHRGALAELGVLVLLAAVLPLVPRLAPRPA